MSHENNVDAGSSVFIHSHTGMQIHPREHVFWTKQILSDRLFLYRLQ